MNKECELIKDILPLYVDEVCSEESKKLVDEHLATCKDCKKEAEQMKSNLELPLNSDGSDVKGFKKFVQKKIWLKVIMIAIVLCIGLVAANWIITTHYSEIWPKVDEEGIKSCVEVVDLNGEFYLHQDDLFGFGEIMFISSDEEYEDGVIKFYLGEQGLNTLDPRGMARMWQMNEKYSRIPGIFDEKMEEDFIEEGDCLKKEDVTKIVYCHKNGKEVATLWEKGDKLPVVGEEK